MKKITYAVVAIFSVAVILVSCKEAKKEKKEIKKEKQEVHEQHDVANAAYQCPMDCEHGKTYDKEGNCPVCNMKLKKVASKSVDSTMVSSAKKVNCKENYKNCGKDCKGKTDCKNKKECKSETATAQKMCSKCDPANCRCEGVSNSDKKTCAKSKTKSCKASFKGNA